jgi:hypothetical protein
LSMTHLAVSWLFGQTPLCSLVRHSVTFSDQPFSIFG